MHLYYIVGYRTCPLECVTFLLECVTYLTQIVEKLDSKRGPGYNLLTITAVNDWDKGWGCFAFVIVTCAWRHGLLIITMHYYN